MTRRSIIAGNWKMYKTLDEALDLAGAIADGVTGLQGREIIVFPPAPWAKHVADRCRGTGVEVGMQNMHFEKEGAFTGEVSPLMVKDAGCRYVLIGHSERRHIFGETDDMVNKKIRAALDNNIEPMVCVGELIEEREAGRTEDVLKRQVEGALKGVSQSELAKIVIAYEPVWAIGTGKVATPETADEAHRTIRRILAKHYGEEAASAVPILYGGSVKPDNIAGLYAMEHIDGALVGGASLKADSFLAIARVSLK